LAIPVPPLWKKLGFKPGMKVCALNTPQHYAKLIDGPNDWVMVKQPKDADAIHLFITERQELGAIATLSKHMPPAIMLWVSWPNKTSPPSTGLSEDETRRKS
jgi:hypothetical protein